MVPKPQGNTISARKLYLTGFNLVFACLWVSVFVDAVSNARHGKVQRFLGTEERARWVQTAALIEIVHSATGLIKSPVSTTALQVVTRVIQVWMVWYCFPSSTMNNSLVYLALLFAWSIADTIRYVYLAANLWDKAPRALVWLRYTMFYPLYPVGIGAEWWLLYSAIEPAGKINALIPPVFWFCLMLYIPGSYKMYTYMIKQRRKTLGGGKKNN